MMRSSEEKGTTAVELFVVLAISAILGLAMYELFSIPQKTYTGTLAGHQMGEFRKQLVHWIQNSSAWQSTITAPGNDSLKCLRDHSDCTGAGGRFAIYDLKGKLFYDPRPPQNGFTMQGALCDSFDGVAGNSQCPFHMDLWWTALCPPSGPCLDPQVKISGKTTYSPAANDDSRKLPLNELNYGVMDFVRGQLDVGAGSGTGDTIAKWLTSLTMGNSIIAQDGNGRIGIETRTPQSTLDVVGSMMIGGYSGVDSAPEGGLGVGGTVGIGMPNPAAMLDVNGGIKIGNDSSLCTNEKSGTLRWTGMAFEACMPNLSGGYDWCPAVRGCRAADCTPSQTQVCQIQNGQCTQECKPDGTWAGCVVNCQCASGYSLQGGVCVSTGT